MVKGKTCMTEDWRPDIGVIVKLKQQFPRYDIEFYIEECRDHWLGNGKMMKDWNAVFRNWLRRAGNFGQPKLVPYHTEKIPQPADNVIPLATLHAARTRGIATANKTEKELDAEIWEHDQARHSV